MVCWREGPPRRSFSSLAFGTLLCILTTTDSTFHCCRFTNTVSLNRGARPRCRRHLPRHVSTPRHPAMVCKCSLTFNTYLFLSLRVLQSSYFFFSSISQILCMYTSCTLLAMAPVTLPRPPNNSFVMDQRHSSISEIWLRL